MNSAPSSPFRYSHSSLAAILVTVLLALALGTATGCGSSGSPSGGGQKLSGNTAVTPVLTSTANDQLVEFDLVLQSITLTDKSGKTANLLLAPQGYEFVHLNGQAEPLPAVTIPQGIYTSATATIGGAQFTCVALLPDGGLSSDTFAYGYTPNSQVTVNLPSPITISGDNMALSVNLQVLQSASFPSTCYFPDYTVPTYEITPTFNITPATLSSSPTNPVNGKVAGLDGQVSAIGADGSGFTLSVSEGDALSRSVAIRTNGNTMYQGIASFSGLAVDTFVDMDAAIQSDGSLTATRIAVENPSAADVVIGPVMYVSGAEAALVIWGRDDQGTDFVNTHVIGGQYFSFDSAVFQISGQLSNLQNLPFVASFNASNLVAGQNIYLSSPELSDTSNPYTEIEAITLMPQVIDGTIIGSAVAGNFTDYTVSLASYDLFPDLAIQQGQTTRLNNPDVVEAYVDNNTQMLNTQTLAAGNTLRFYGLVFNDNGTLRMDCAQVNDGVTLTPSPSAHLGVGRIQVVKDVQSGLRPMIRTVTRANQVQP